MTIGARNLLTRTPWVWLALAQFAACSVFEPPPLEENPPPGNGGTGTGGTDAGLAGEDSGAGMGGIGSGGNNPDSGGTAGGGPDAGVGGAGGDASLTGGAGGTDGGGDAGPSSGGDEGPWWIKENEHGCEVVGVPTSADRPAVSDPGEDLPPIYVGMSRIRLSQIAFDEEGKIVDDVDAWRGIGFDLDGRCTRSATCEVDEQLVDEQACRNTAPFDGNNCRDNQIGRLYSTGANTVQIGEYFGLTERDWNCEIHRGAMGQIFKISNYNGKKNDSNVRVDSYTTIGLQDLPTWTCRGTIDGELNDAWDRRVRWLPTSRWKIAERSIDLAAQPDGQHLKNAKLNDPAAYVRSGYLVVRFNDGEYWLNGQRAGVPGIRNIIHRPLLVAKMEQQEDRTWFWPEATIQWVGSPSELLEAFEELGFCENMCSSYELLKGYLNGNADSLLRDEILPNVDCEALSYAVELQAHQVTATAADVETVDPPQNCPPPRHPDAPPHGCVCQAGACVIPDGGT